MSRIVLLGNSVSKWEFIYKCKGQFNPTTYNETHSLIMGSKHIIAVVINRLTEFAIDTINKSEYVYLFEDELEEWRNLDGELPSNFIANPSYEKILSHLGVKSDNPRLEYENWYKR